MTIEEFESQLQGFGEELTNIQTILTAAAGQIVNQLKSQVPVDTGDLKNSIKARVTANTIQIEMLYYGPFQNFGVDGKEESVATPVPTFGVTPQPRSGSTYKFGVRVKGLKPQPFFNLEDMSRFIEEYVANALID